MRKEVKKMKLSQKLTNALFSLNNKTCLLLTYQKDVEMSKLYQPRSNFENEIRRAKSNIGSRVKAVFRRMYTDGSSGLIHYGLKWEIAE